jgi:hypothetical protein
MGTPSTPPAETTEFYLGHLLSKDHYRVQRVTLAAPSRGVLRQTVTCNTCGRSVRLRFQSTPKWFFRILFIVLGLGLIWAGVLALTGIGTGGCNLALGIGAIVGAFVTMALGFILANFVSNSVSRSWARAARERGIPLPLQRLRIQDSAFSPVADLRHRLIALAEPGSRTSKLLPADQARGAQWVGDLLRERQVTIEEYQEPSIGGSSEHD